MPQILRNLWTSACRTCHRPYEPLPAETTRNPRSHL